MEFPKAPFGSPVVHNDLPNAVKSADICMYANDTSMSSTIKNTSDLETKIISEFFNICDWLKASKLILNAEY